MVDLEAPFKLAFNYSSAFFLRAAASKGASDSTLGGGYD